MANNMEFPPSNEYALNKMQEELFQDLLAGKPFSKITVKSPGGSFTFTNFIPHPEGGLKERDQSQGDIKIIGGTSDSTPLGTGIYLNHVISFEE